MLSHDICSHGIQSRNKTFCRRCCVTGACFVEWLIYLAPSWCRKCISDIWSKMSCWHLMDSCGVGWIKIHLISPILWPRSSLGHHRWLCNQFPPFFCFPLPSGTWRIPHLSIPDVVFPPLLLSAWSFPPFNCALHDCFGRTLWIGAMSISLQFASFYDGQEVFVCFDCLLDIGMDSLVDNMVCIWKCGSTSFPRLVYYFRGLLWGSMFHKHTERWRWQWSVSVVSWNWEKKKKLLSFQTAFNLVSAADVCAILDSISGLEPSSGKT